ncbi:MAG: imidazolonepropionase, partial [Gemmatimonadota bacterium]|nr:imidazolonepropionase [Gemmatimonadota bacterium]
MPRLSGIGRLVTCAAPRGQGEIGEIERAALVWREGRIVWAGPEASLPAEHASEPALDVDGALVIPGLIDAHTHLGFGGWRADEFARRLAGERYLDIAAAGGGIASTVRATRALDEDALVARAAGFLDGMVALGVTTVEAKSGYGLDLESELRTLRAYRRLDRAGPVRVVPTCLAAHVVPPEHGDDPEAYVRVVIDEILPAVAREGLAAFCDVFVEEGAFTPEQARRILGAGPAHGLRPKHHADKL